MSLTLIEGPAGEPVSLEEAKAWLRVDTAAEDTLITGLITAARMMVESHCAKACLTQRWLWRTSWKAKSLRLPLSPLQSVEEVAVLDEDGARHVIAPAHYQVIAGMPGRVLKRLGFSAPLSPAFEGGFEVSFTCGFGAAGDVPELLRRAVLMLVAHWFENREPVAFGEGRPLPLALDAMLASYREMRL